MRNYGKHGLKECDVKSNESSKVHSQFVTTETRARFPPVEGLPSVLMSFTMQPKQLLNELVIRERKSRTSVFLHSSALTVCWFSARYHCRGGEEVMSCALFSLKQEGSLPARIFHIFQISLLVSLDDDACWGTMHRSSVV